MTPKQRKNRRISRLEKQKNRHLKFSYKSDDESEWWLLCTYKRKGRGWVEKTTDKNGDKLTRFIVWSSSLKKHYYVENLKTINIAAIKEN